MAANADQRKWRHMPISAQRRSQGLFGERGWFRRCRFLTSLATSSAYSMSSSCSVSMWSVVKAIGTSSRFFWPFLARPLIASSVWGPSHGKGPTWNTRGDTKPQRPTGQSQDKTIGQSCAKLPRKAWSRPCTRRDVERREIWVSNNNIFKSGLTQLDDRKALNNVENVELNFAIWRAWNCKRFCKR